MRDDLDDPRRDSFQPVAQKLGVPVDALLFIVDALNVAPQYCGEEPNDVSAMARHCSAAELCNAVKLYAADLWAELAPSVLKEFGLNTSEDLSRLVFALVDAGLMEANADDRPEDFLGACRFDVP